ncbi:MAG: RDD family protein [Acidaminococcaceae bacterium]|nr:RDD family protein [Acidaminococcaceae bacterium]
MTASTVNYHSWRRFWARMFDYFLLGFLFLLLSSNSLLVLHNIFLYSALQLIFIISAEAFMLARTGTTPGKSLLGLHVVSPAAPLDFNLAWKRTFWAYVKGLWLGIPIMMFVPAWFARQVLQGSGSTIWDQACGTHIEAEPVSRLRYVLFGIVFFMIFAAIGNYEVFLQSLAQGQ